MLQKQINMAAVLVKFLARLPRVKEVTGSNPSKAISSLERLLPLSRALPQSG